MIHPFYTKYKHCDFEKQNPLIGSIKTGKNFSKKPSTKNTLCIGYYTVPKRVFVIAYRYRIAAEKGTLSAQIEN